MGGSGFVPGARRLVPHTAVPLVQIRAHLLETPGPPGRGGASCFGRCRKEGGPPARRPALPALSGSVCVWSCALTVRFLNPRSLHPQIFQKPLMESELLTEKEGAMIFVNWKELIMCNIKLLK